MSNYIRVPLERVAGVGDYVKMPLEPIPGGGLGQAPTFPSGVTRVRCSGAGAVASNHPARVYAREATAYAVPIADRERRNPGSVPSSELQSALQAVANIAAICQEEAAETRDLRQLLQSQLNARVGNQPSQAVPPGSTAPAKAGIIDNLNAAMEQAGTTLTNLVQPSSAASAVPTAAQVLSMPESVRAKMRTIGWVLAASLGALGAGLAWWAYKERKRAKTEGTKTENGRRRRRRRNPLPRIAHDVAGRIDDFGERGGDRALYAEMRADFIEAVAELKDGHPQTRAMGMDILRSLDAELRQRRYNAGRTPMSGIKSRQRRYAKSAGRAYWFEPGAMQFFGTRLHGDAYEGRGGIYFVTSEQPPHGKRCYSVRQAIDRGDRISTVGQMCSFDSLAEAEQAAEALADGAEHSSYEGRRPAWDRNRRRKRNNVRSSIRQAWYRDRLKKEQAVHLQGIGAMPGKEAGKLQPGDRTVWNYGYTYEVMSVREVSPKFVEAILRNEDTGKESPRRLKKDRLVAIASPKRKSNRRRRGRRR